MWRQLAIGGLAAFAVGGGLATWLLLAQGDDVAQGGPRFASLAPGGEFSVVGRLIAEGHTADKLCFADGFAATDGQGTITAARGQIGYFGASESQFPAFAALSERAMVRVQGLVGRQVFQHDPALVRPDGSLQPFSSAIPDGTLQENYPGGPVHYDPAGLLVAGYAFCEPTSAALLDEVGAYLTALAAQQPLQPGR